MEAGKTDGGQGPPGFHHGHAALTVWVTLAKSLHYSIRVFILTFSQLVIQQVFIVLNTYYVLGTCWVHGAQEEQNRHRHGP